MDNVRTNIINNLEGIPAPYFSSPSWDAHDKGIENNPIIMEHSS